MTEHSAVILARALREADLPDLAEKAEEGHYHDFLSPLAIPSVQLAADLAAVGTSKALAVRARHLNGEFDATKAESDEWAKSMEGQEAFQSLVARCPPAESDLLDLFAKAARVAGKRLIEQERTDPLPNGSVTATTFPSENGDFILIVACGVIGQAVLSALQELKNGWQP